MSQHHRRLSARPWQRVRKLVLARAGHRCEIRDPATCTGWATEVDHIVPLAQGGARLDPANLRAACKPCNGARNRARPAVDQGWII